MHRELAAVAQEQDGLLSAADLRAHAVTPYQRRAMFSSGWLTRVGPNVYAVAGAPRTHRFQLRRGLLALGPHAAISYEAAANLHGLDQSNPNAVEFTVLRSDRTRHFIENVHSTKWLPRLDIVDVDGFAVTSATRTIIDLAHRRHRRRKRVEAAIDSAVRLGLSSPAAIARRLETLRGSGRWGCRLIDELVVDSGGHSPLERRFLQIVRSVGLPRPTTQAIERKGSRHIARVDFLFEQHGVVVEVSGQHGHSSPTERRRDAQRRNELQDIGLRVFEYTYADVTREPAMVTRTLRERLDVAA